MKRITFTTGQGKDKDGKDIPELDCKQALAFARMVETFGAYTAVMGVGGWAEAQDSPLIEEPSLILSAVVEDYIPTSDARIMAIELGVIFNQTAVMLTIEPLSVVEFVSHRDVANVN
jgi:hypothetical protein